MSNVRRREMHLPTVIAEVLSHAIIQIRERALPVYTFALYFDHESEAISVCVDTEENSARTVLSMNAYNTKHFHRAVSDGDLKMAKLWQASLGRSLSLGDFALVNAGRTELPGVEQDELLFATMLNALVAAELEVSKLAPAPRKLIFACSGVANEVEYVWSAASDA
jgi:hypothetical protein